MSGFPSNRDNNNNSVCNRWVWEAWAEVWDMEEEWAWEEEWEAWVDGEKK